MSFYGDNFRWFTGEVKRTDDTRGRVQVRIYGVHGEEISDDDLPWAQCVIPSTEGGVSGIGRGTGLKETAFVFGFFLDGALSQHPVVLGSMVKNEAPTRAQKEAVVSSTTEYIPGEIVSGGVSSPTNFATKWFDATQSSNPINQKRLLIMEFLMNQKTNDQPMFTIGHAAAIAGNLEAEVQTFDPDKTNEIGAYGLAQWLGDRLKALKNFAKKNNRDYKDAETQLMYLIHELKGVGNAKWGDPEFDGASIKRSAYNESKKATTHYGYPNVVNGKGMYDKVNYTWIWMVKYEVCGNYKNEIVNREKFAKRAYEEYQSQISQAKKSE